MKKVLLIISEYFFNFLSVLFVLSLFLIYIMFEVPGALWIGRGMSGTLFYDNFGSGLVSFFDGDYFIFFLIPLFHFLVIFLFISIFVWIYYRDDKEVGKFGFRNTVLSILSIFALVYLPIKASDMNYDIQERREREIALVQQDGVIDVHSRLDKEVQKIYQSLYYEDILKWRTNPLAVVDYELEKGDLKYLSVGPLDKLTLIATSSDKSSGFSQATVLLENEKQNAEIYLGSYWSDDGQVWMVKGYKKLEE